MNVYIILHTCAYVICIRIHKCVCVCLGVCVASFQFPSEQCFLCFFPTSLCGALVFDSVSVPPPSRHLRRLRPLFVAHHLSPTATSTFVLPGRRGTYGTGLALVARLVPFFCPGRPRHFAWQAWHLAWQAWHLATSTVFLRGRHGTWRHPPSFCVAHLSNTQPWTHISFKHTYSFHTQTWTHTHIYTQRFHTQHTPTHNSFTQTWTHSSFTRNFVWVTHISFTNLNTQTSTLDKNGSFEWSGRNWVL